MDPSTESPATDASKPRWQPLCAMDRRVLGVLAEKAKTTPDLYPMSLNAICTGCNQKNNRAPVVQYEPEEVEESLDRLRQLGAVGLVEGYGRVQKYRHYLYEWLGVDKVELAVMTELFLRGDQTVGELRGRASRMEPIADLAALRPVVDSLKAKGLVVALTPEGRGHVVTHALYKLREMEGLQAKYQGVGASDVHMAAVESTGDAAPPTAHPAATSDSAGRALAELRDQLTQLRSDVDELRVQQQQLVEEVRTLKDALGG
ncbi:MAG: YceH family protein [Planctomycetaceae bacterium]|nr:YceH family protein [Planctomycetaceae bacterium]